MLIYSKSRLTLGLDPDTWTEEEMRRWLSAVSKGVVVRDPAD
jgi:hypothetical protein